MKRDLDLVIKLLEYLEEREEISVITDVSLPGYDDREVAYNLQRMYEAGFLDAEVQYSSTTPSRIIDVHPFGLSWEGHEFLDAARNDSLVRKARSKIGDSLSSVPFSIFKELLLSLLRGELGIA